MRRILLVAALLLGAVHLPSTPAGADPGHERPRITEFRFTERPLKSGTLERIEITAHDPDSWISEIQLRWEDPDDAGGIIFAHTYCVQDPELEKPGVPAELKLDVEFDHPAHYHVEARAISQKRCDASKEQRISKTVEMDVVVRDPARSFSDPDDVAGSLDVVRAAHSQEVDEETLKSNVVHVFEMSEELADAPLSGTDDWVQLFFDLDDDEIAERSMFVDADGSGGLRAEMRDASGSVVGEGTATAEGKALRVTFARRLIGRGTNVYRWYGMTHDSSGTGCSHTSPCDDLVPDSGSFTHRL